MEFIQAKHFRKTSGRTIDLIVVHDMEAEEKGTTAEAVARYFSTTDKLVSAHLCFDNNSIVQCVKDQDVAFAAPGANHNGKQYEFAGFARQKRHEWLDPFGHEMLTLGSLQAAEDIEKYNLPLQYVDEKGLLAGARGITTHWDVSQAFGKSTHTDPGPEFPMDFFLQKIEFVLGRKVPTVPEIVDDVVFSLACPQYGLHARWDLFSDGGIGCHNGAPFFGSVPGLPEKDRLGDRHFVALIPFNDGYTIVSNILFQVYSFDSAVAQELGIIK